MTTEAWPHYEDDELAAVADVMKSGSVNQWSGDRVVTFQKQFAKYCSVPHAIAVANGSVALELALRALNVTCGDEVIVTSRSFIASASCVSMIGATPVFADVDPQTHLISATTIAPLITPKTRAIIPVHLAGWPCDMNGIMELARAHEIAVIEDCAQSIGAKIDDRPTGSFGHAAAFSFCQDKIISTGGEGGMVVFRDPEQAKWASSFKDHGKNFDKMFDQVSNYEFRYVHDMVGTNLRMTEMQAAIGLCQLAKLDGWIETRTKNAKVWREALSKVDCIITANPPPNVKHAYYRFYGLIDHNKIRPGVTRSEILVELNNHDVPAYSGSCPEIYREEAFSGLSVNRQPVAQQLSDWSIAFLVHPTLDRARLIERANRAAEIILKYQAA